MFASENEATAPVASSSSSRRGRVRHRATTQTMSGNSTVTTAYAASNGLPK